MNDPVERLRSVFLFISRRALSLRGRRAIWGYLFISPWIVGFLIFNLYPIVSVFYLSFTEYTGLRPPRFVGLANYVEMFRYDRLALKSLGNTVYYVTLYVPLRLLIGFTAALLANRKLRGISVLRTGLYVPTLVPLPVSVVIWMWLMHFDFGIINIVLRAIGLPPVNWLGSTVMSKPSVVIIGLWQIGTIMMIFLAGLQSVPAHLYEAAEIDGATWLHKLVFITVPMMSPIIFFTLILNVISSFQVFTSAMIATGGGPLNSTLFYALYMYRQSFQHLHLGYGSAMATILFLIIMILTLLIFRSERYWVTYERL